MTAIDPVLAELLRARMRAARRTGLDFVELLEQSSDVVVLRGPLPSEPRTIEVHEAVDELADPEALRKAALTCLALAERVKPAPDPKDVEMLAALLPPAASGKSTQKVARELLATGRIQIISVGGDR